MARKKKKHSTDFYKLPIVQETLERIIKKQDNVNSPAHYNTGKIEVIEFIEDQKLNYHIGNSVKYLCRAGKKDPSKLVEDLEKAIWYIKRYIEIQKPESERLRPNNINKGK